MNLRTLILVAAVVCGVHRNSLADAKEELQEHLTTAYKAYKEQRWQDVLDALEKAYAIEPKPELHYSMGQVYVKMGRCPDAVKAYETYLETHPKADNADVAREAIATCKAKEKPEPPPEKPKPPVEPKPTPRPRPPSEGVDGVGLTLVGGGILLALGGAGLYVIARGNVDDSESAVTYGAQNDLYQGARTKRLVSIVLGAVGVVATTAGIVHYARKKPRERGVSVVPTRAGGLVTWVTPF